MRLAASFTSAEVLRFSTTPPASVLWAMAAEETLSVTGKPSFSAAAAASDAWHTMPSGTLSPCAFRSCFALYSLNTCAFAPVVRGGSISGGSSLRAQLRPMKAAASKAVSASSSPIMGATPRLESSSASGSGMPSGKEETTAARAPVACDAAAMARAVVTQLAGFIFGCVGVSRITMPTSKPPFSTSVKVAMSFSGWPQMKVW